MGGIGADLFAYTTWFDYNIQLAYSWIIDQWSNKAYWYWCLQITTSTTDFVV